jgi:hypothetical protein
VTSPIKGLEFGDPFAYLGTSVVDVGTATRFLDKLWMVVTAAGAAAPTRAAAVADRATLQGPRRRSRRHSVAVTDES